MIRKGVNFNNSFFGGLALSSEILDEMDRRINGTYVLAVGN
jgi:hypothetical protein